MATDYMTDEVDAPASSSEEDKAPKEDEGEKTCLIDKTILSGKTPEVGDELNLRIVAIHDNELEVAYASEESGDSEPEQAEEPGASPEEDDSMMG